MVFSFFYSVDITSMYIPDYSPPNIILFLASVLGVGIVILRELKPTTRLGYSKFASRNTVWKVL